MFSFQLRWKQLEFTGQGTGKKVPHKARYAKVPPGQFSWVLISTSMRENHSRMEKDQPGSFGGDMPSAHRELRTQFVSTERLETAHCAEHAEVPKSWRNRGSDWSLSQFYQHILTMGPHPHQIVSNCISGEISRILIRKYNYPAPNKLKFTSLTFREKLPVMQRNKKITTHNEKKN